MSCQAVVIQADADNNNKLVKQSVPIPEPGPGQALVRVQYAAQNPTDVQSFDAKVFGAGAILGCDFYGVVEKLGPGVTRVAKGDVVAGLIWGGEIPGLGAFSEYTIADQNIVFKVPQGIDGAAASTVPLAANTAWLALFSKRCLNIDRRNAANTPVLIWGGSSSVGLFAVQLAAIAGLRVITTCSPRNAELVRSLGASEVFDYHDPDVVDKIRAAAPGMRYAFDTIGDGDTSTLSSRALASNEQVYLCTVRPGKAFTENVTANTIVSDVLVWTAFLKDHSYRGQIVYPASKEDHDLSTELYDVLPTWLETGKVKANPTKIFNGLDAVHEGFDEFRSGKVSAYKIVYRL
ncbi:hypothetical protein VTN49DRAFT_6688 [Thermomyces lanuginosus]|uniref:uncharacterized protein n=1 Tax=Thermomyces lanuginosus TaxID=5541 RepID=UPI003744598A